MKLSLLVLRCNDINVSREFYQRLGLSFSLERHGGGPEHFAAKLGDLVIELYPRTSAETVDNSRIGFSLAKLQESLKLVSVSDSYEFGGSKTYIVIDPDGRKVELTQGH